MKTNHTFKVSTKPEDFFFIDLKLIQDRLIFPFQLYVYNPAINQCTLFLEGNGPLGKDKLQILSFVIERGGRISIRNDQQKTFLTFLKISENDVPSLSNPKHLSSDVAGLLKAQKLAKDALNNTSHKKTEFILKEELYESIIQGDFSNIISAAKNKIAAFSCTISPTVSLARYLALDLLYEDNFYNRVVALSYHLATEIGIVDQSSLGNLVCASFLYHLGNTHVDFATLQKPSTEYIDDDRKKYRRHPGSTQSLLRKINLDLDVRCYQIMLEHHERTDGSGFPNFKRDNIDPLAQVLGAVSHIFEYHYGLVTGEKTPLQNILNNLRNKTQPLGLETGFGAQVQQSLINLLSPALFVDTPQKNTRPKSQLKVA